MHLPLLGMLIASGRRGTRTHPPAGVDRRDRTAASEHPAATSAPHLLLLGAVPQPLRAALRARYILRDLGGDMRRVRAIVAPAGTAVDADLMARLRDLRIIVILGGQHGAGDLGAAISHRIRVALTGEDPARMAQLALANLDACFDGRPLPSAIV